MTPTDFAEARKGLGLTQTAMAELFGVTRSTVAKWEAGKHPIPRAVTVAVELMQRAGKAE